MRFKCFLIFLQFRLNQLASDNVNGRIFNNNVIFAAPVVGVDQWFVIMLACACWSGPSLKKLIIKYYDFGIALRKECTYNLAEG